MGAGVDKLHIWVDEVLRDPGQLMEFNEKYRNHCQNGNNPQNRNPNGPNNNNNQNGDHDQNGKCNNGGGANQNDNGNAKPDGGASESRHKGPGPKAWTETFLQFRVTVQIFLGSCCRGTRR